MIKKVTITGADDSINPSDLIPLSEKFPFVEWGILLSRNSMGQHRFPSYSWLTHLLYPLRNNFNLSGHLCGSYVREIFSGYGAFFLDIKPYFDMFERFQLNTHGVPHEFDNGMIKLLQLFQNKEFIFQYDNVNSKALDFAVESGIILI